MCSSEIRWIDVNHTSTFRVTTSINDNLITLAWNLAIPNPSLPVYRQSQTPEGVQDVSFVRSGILLVGSTLSLIDEIAFALINHRVFINRTGNAAAVREARVIRSL